MRDDAFRQLGRNHRPSLSDRSSRIASEVFFAAEDEYADRETGVRVTHRYLAQQILDQVLAYFGLEDSDLGPRPSTFIESVIEQVRQGYGTCRRLSDAELFRGLGFHVGAELLADEEFALIDHHITDGFPRLQEHLQSTRIPEGMPAYQWISLHVQVEIEHFDHAVAAVILANEYYVGEEVDDVVESVLEGFKSFQEFQMRFFSGLPDHLSE
jgi:hypothetical protein